MARNKNRKLVSSTFMLLLAATVALTACGGPENKGQESAGTGGEKSPAASGASANTDEKFDLSYTTWSGDKVVANPYAVKAMEERFNVNITIRPYQSSDAFQQQLFLDIASGDVPDSWSDLKVPDYDKFVSQELVAELPVEMIKENAPNYYNWLVKNLGEDPFVYYRRDGKNYTLPSIWTLGTDGYVLGIRQDWLSNVGIDKIPETLEELEQALIKFRNDDPDQNGKKDTYGMIARAENVTDIFSPIFAAYGVYPGAFTEEDGKIVRGEIEAGAKEALSLLKKWYKDQLIDPEFIVNKKSNMHEKVISNKVGVVKQYWWYFAPKETFSGGMYYEKMPDAKWAVTAGPKGPNGDYGATQENSLSDATGVQFAKRLEKEPGKLAKYLQIMDGFSFSEEVRASVVYGEEGKTFKKTDAGDYEYLPPYDQESERIKFGIGPQYSFPGTFNDYDFQTIFMTASKYRDLRKEIEHVGRGKYDVLPAVSKPIYNEYYDRLNQFTIKNFIDFITGSRPIDEFDAYVDEWLKMGGDKVMKEAQQKYDEIFKK